MVEAFGRPFQPPAPLYEPLPVLTPGPIGHIQNPVEEAPQIFHQLGQILRIELAVQRFVAGPEFWLLPPSKIQPYGDAGEVVREKRGRCGAQRDKDALETASEAPGPFQTASGLRKSAWLTVEARVAGPNPYHARRS